MKFLAFSDLHLHNPGNFGVDLTTGLSKRLLEQQKVTTQIVNIAIEEKVDAVLFIGDLVHSVGSVSTEVLNTAHLFFNSLRSKSIPVYFVPGNHDLNNRKNPKWYNYSCKVFEPSQPPKNIKLIGFHEKVDYEEVREYDIVAIHQTPINARVGNYVFKEGFNWEELAKNNKLVLCGHIHQRQYLADNCIIVGSPMQLTFGDTGDRGIFIVDSETGAAEFRKLQYPEFITVENYWDTKDDGNYYRVLNKDSRPPDSITTENIRVQSTPEYLEERIKSTNFFEILKEWLTIREKPESYLESLSDIVDEKFQLGKKIYNGRLRQVTIKDFLSTGDITYRVEDGFTLVLGENDVFDSNGSGKSTLFEAIYWCLFGKTTKGLSGDDVIRNRPEQQKDCKVMLSLIAADGSELNISRSREEGIGIFRKAPDAIVFYDVCGDRKLTDCQKLLESLLGIDENLFRTSCYFSQENLLMLTGLEDAARTEMITDLLGFESYNDLYSKVHKKIETVEKKVLDFNSKINAGEIQIAGYKGKLDVYTESLETLQETYQRTQEKIEESKVLVEAAKSELEDFTVAEIPFRDFEGEEKILTVRREENKKYIDGLTAVLDIASKSIHEVETKYSVSLNETSHANLSFEELKKEVEMVGKADEGVHCLKCGSLVSKEVKQMYISSKTEELKSRKKLYEDCQYQSDALKKTLVEQKEVRDVHSKTKATYDTGGLKIEKEISDLNKERRSYETKKQEQASQKVQLQSKIQTYVDRINEYTNQLATTASQIQTTKTDIKKLQGRLQECESLILATQEEIKKLNSQVEILEFWKIAFSPKGIRALLLDKFCNEFSTILNNYLSEISNESMRLIMTPTSMTKGGEERNKIGMIVKFKEFDVSYNSLSGGEKRRVDCSLIFALSKYLEEKYELGPQGLLGIMVLDELFSSLDVEGIDSLVSLLERESKEKSIFVIDHHPRLTAFANRIFTVRKNQNISALEVDSTI